MPCTDGRDFDDRDGDDAFEERLKKRLDKVTQVACELVKAIRQADERVRHYDIFSTLSEQTKKWIYLHDNVDKKRLRKEAKEKELKELKAKALAKLTPKERKLLDV